MKINIEIDGNEAIIIISGDGKQIVRTAKCLHMNSDFDTGELKYWLDHYIAEFQAEPQLNAKVEGGDV